MQARLVLERNMWIAVTLLNDRTEEDMHEEPLVRQNEYLTNAKQQPTGFEMCRNLKISV